MTLTCSVPTWRLYIRWELGRCLRETQRPAKACSMHTLTGPVLCLGASDAPFPKPSREVLISVYWFKSCTAVVGCRQRRGSSFPYFALAASHSFLILSLHTHIPFIGSYCISWLLKLATHPVGA